MQKWGRKDGSRNAVQRHKPIYITEAQYNIWALLLQNVHGS